MAPFCARALSRSSTCSLSRCRRHQGRASVFDSTEAEADQRAPITAMALESSQALEGGAMLLRYRIQNALCEATSR